MGQAWCKEKSTKAQDSKSPLDRVFLRCAHRIYPGLKDEGSVLGGATQRVTSSEIGYASSPPRDVLTRGRSIDSVDRPFHPSEWVDVNLEVPVTPRATSVMTNLTLDTTIYPPTTLTSTNSSGSNLREFTPVPPPRRRKKNRGRPLPPKPDEIARTRVDRVTTQNSRETRHSSNEPLYSSVKIPKDWSTDKEIYEHKINGTGRIIPSIVVAGSRSTREKSSRDEKSGEKKSFRPKSTSTVSLPNYSELKVSRESSFGADDEGELKVRKITAAGSLPALITSGALENFKRNENDKNEKDVDTKHEDEERNRSIDEVDFSFEVNKNQETLNSSLKLEGPALTSTPIKNGFENDSRTPTTIGGWFLHQDRSPEYENLILKNTNESQGIGNNSVLDRSRDSQCEIFFEAEEDLLEQNKDNRARIEEGEKLERARTSLKRTLSNESEPFDSCEEKELREAEQRSTGTRSNFQVKLVDRTISEESLPQEMLENEMDFFEEKRTSHVRDKSERSNEEKKVVDATKNDDTRTPPPSPEPRIKPEILDNDHSTLLKVLREEAEESNLSSMTPSLTELEAALSDMLEREDDQETQEEISDKIILENLKTVKVLENPIEPKIVQIDLDKDQKHSDLSISLKNILGEMKDSQCDEKVSETFDENYKSRDIDLTNGNKLGMENISKNDFVEIPLDVSSRTTSPSLEPPEKPSRLHQLSHEEAENFRLVPTPPRRKNRFSGPSPSIFNENKRRSCDRSATPDDPYPNDRLI